MIDSFIANEATCQVFWDAPCIFATVLSDEFGIPCAGIRAGDRDANEEADTMLIHKSRLDLGEDDVGLIFQGFNIPEGSTIDSAFVIFTKRDSAISSSFFSVGIRGLIEQQVFLNHPDPDTAATVLNKYDDPSSVGNFPDGPEDILWDIAAGEQNWIKDEPYRSEDISPIIRGLIDSSGIAPGDWINLMFIANEGSVERKVWSFEAGTPDKAAQLCIFYKSTIDGEIEYIAQPAATIDDITVKIEPTGIDECLEGNAVVSVNNNNFEHPLCSESAEYRIRPEKRPNHYVAWKLVI